jgi:hypothetical protein
MSDQLARGLLGFAQCRWENLILDKKIDGASET